MRPNDSDLLHRTHGTIVVLALSSILALTVCRSAGAGDATWNDYQALLAEHVSRGTRHGVELNLVDYDALGADPRFAAARAALDAFDPAALAPGAETIAFYVNAYNLLALAVVVDNAPLDSIRDAGNLFRPVWKRTAGRIGGRAVSLDEIEHEVLRPLGEPRIHLAIVCASVSCPDLRREVYRSAGLDEQLDDQARRFLANPGKGARRIGETLRVSRIFDWFEDDFGAVGGVDAFVRRYLDDLPGDVAIEADLDYDWRLNRR